MYGRSLRLSLAVSTFLLPSRLSRHFLHPAPHRPLLSSSLPCSGAPSSSSSSSLPLLLLLSPSALFALAACAPSVHHLVLFTFPPRSLPFLPSPHRTPPPCSSILPSHHPSSAPPPPPDSEPSLFLAHRPRLPPSSLPPPPLPLPPSHLSRHCRRAPGVPQTLFSTIKLLSLPLPGSCKNNLG